MKIQFNQELAKKSLQLKNQITYGKPTFPNEIIKIQEEIPTANTNSSVKDKQLINQVEHSKKNKGDYKGDYKRNSKKWS